MKTTVRVIKQQHSSPAPADCDMLAAGADDDRYLWLMARQALLTLLAVLNVKARLKGQRCEGCGRKID